MVSGPCRHHRCSIDKHGSIFALPFTLGELDDSVIPGHQDGLGAGFDF